MSWGWVTRLGGCFGGILWPVPPIKSQKKENLLHSSAGLSSGSPRGVVALPGASVAILREVSPPAAHSLLGNCRVS